MNYKDVLKDSSIQYHKKENEIYFVNDWMGRRVFKDLIADFVDYFGINMDNNMLEGIFEADEENQQELIEQYVDYELTCNSKFINALAELNEEIAKGVKVESQQEEDTVIDSWDYGTKVGIETQDDSEGETSKSSTDRNKNEFPEEEDEGKEEKRRESMLVERKEMMRTKMMKIQAMTLIKKEYPQNAAVMKVQITLNQIRAEKFLHLLDTRKANTRNLMRRRIIRKENPIVHIAQIICDIMIQTKQITILSM